MNRDTQLIFERYMYSLSEETLGSGTMSVEELKDYLLTIKTATPVYVEVDSVAPMSKTNNPYLGTIKHSTISGIAGGDYEISAMNREIDANTDPNASADSPAHEPTFKSAPLWNGKGKRVSSLVIQHIDTGEYYLAIGTPKSGSATYTLNGEPIDKAKLEPFLKKSYESKKQADVGISAEKQVIPRYPLLKNIKKIKIKNVELNVA
jgi:hypothetical protein